MQKTNMGFFIKILLIMLLASATVQASNNISKTTFNSTKSYYLGDMNSLGNNDVFRFIYLLNTNQGYGVFSITQCLIQIGEGILPPSCKDITISGPVNYVSYLAIDPGLGNVLIAANAGGITQCYLEEHSGITLCKDVPIPGANDPMGVTIDKNGYVYIANNQGHSITQCPYIYGIGIGDTSRCKSIYIPEDYPGGITADNTFNKLYIIGGSVLDQCDLDVSGIVAGSCNNTGVSGLSQGAEVTVTKSYIYITDYSYVRQCPILPNGNIDIKSCSNANLPASPDGSGFQGYGLAIDDAIDDQQVAIVTGGPDTNSTISCLIDPSGAIGSCHSMPIPLTDYPVGVVLGAVFGN